MRNTLIRSIVLASSAISTGAIAQELEEESSSRRGSVDISPYIEASQVLSAQVQPGSDVVTYTQLAAGVDASITTRNSAASASIRYERQIGWGDVQDSDTVSGLARASLAVIPQAVTLEAGALAARTRVEGNGSTSLGAFGGNQNASSQIYSAYAGPSFQTNAGDVEVSGNYQIGYTRVESPESVSTDGELQNVDIFDDSISQSANVRVGVAPRTALPIGVGVGAGWNRQDISNLDQRVDDRHVRGDVTVPISRTFAVTGGVGYEEVTISSRDAVRDANGDPIVGSDGRLSTDTSQPREIAYETDGLIWDVGALWRPSARTQVQASVGRRYGSTTYYGSLSYAPSSRTNFGISVFDNITGFGGLLSDSLSDLGTDFDGLRNPISGGLNGCVSSTQGSNCGLAALGSIRSSVFRRKGVSASYAHDGGRTQYGLGLGYDRRRFIAAAGTALASADGVVDENFWGSAYVSRQLDRNSSLGLTANATWFESGFDNAGDGLGYSTSVSYYRKFIAGLSGTAAVGLDGFSREGEPDTTTASALLGLRYSF